MPLKVDLHIHTQEDRQDFISYSAYDLIDVAASRGFDALAITNHDRVTYSQELGSYASEQGIVLIPGVEATVGGKHVLLINMPFQNGDIKSFDDILKQKTANNLVIAPHPYFPAPTCLDGQLERNPHLFDAVEQCHFYTDRMNFNKKAVQFAQKHRLPLVANSDAHVMEQFGSTYSLVHAEKSADAIIQAIKTGQVEPVSRPLSLARLVRIFVRVAVTKGPIWTKALELMCIGGTFTRRVMDGRL